MSTTGEEIREHHALPENVPPRSITSIPEPEVYPGTMIENISDAGVHGRNQKGVRRKISPFNLMLILLASAVVIVLYISNVIRVAQLLGEINRIEVQYQRILMDQEMLRAQVNRMSGLERIRKISEEQLGLRNPPTQPVWIKIDEEKIRSLDEAAKKRSK